MTFGLGGLTSKTERRDTTRSTCTLWEEARTSFDAAIKFALDFLWAIKALQMLHMNVTEPGVIEKKFLLGERKILVVVGKYFHIEYLCEMIQWTGSTSTIRAARRAGRSMSCAGNEVRDAVFGGDGHM
jgi:hypothetical protein